MVSVEDKLYTVDDLWELSQGDQRFELIEGVMIEMSPAGDMHGLISLWIGHLIMAHVAAHDLGDATGAETGFILSTDPPTVCAPDVGFVAKARLTPLTGKYYPVAPDLAVEVVSPNDSAYQIRTKVDLYLHAGTRLVWMIYPNERLIDVYKPDSPTITLRGDDHLDGGDVLPGFAVKASSVFERLRD